MLDDNDLHRAGLLPADPAAGCGPALCPRCGTPTAGGFTSLGERCSACTPAAPLPPLPEETRRVLAEARARVTAPGYVPPTVAETAERIRREWPVTMALLADDAPQTPAPSPPAERTEKEIRPMTQPTYTDAQIEQPYEEPRAAAPLAVRREEAAPIEPRGADAAEITPQRPVRQSRETDDVELALACAWLEFPPVEKSRTADVTKGSTSFSYSYAALPDVYAAVGDILRKYKLAPTFRPTRGHMVCRIFHVPSRQWIEGDLPVPPTDARLGVQAIGGALTYQQRRLLCAMLGIVLKEDDDGALASAAAKMPPALRDDARALAAEPGGRVELIARMKSHRVAPDIQRAALVLFDEVAAELAERQPGAT